MDSLSSHPDMASASALIAEARSGRMLILLDAQTRENEGDLIIPAQFATPASINFMARYGRGLICLAFEQERADALALQPMPQRYSNEDSAFVQSIDAAHGITTGISAADRAHTVRVAMEPASGPQDIATPGHLFPLVARPGGVLERAGHTEAGVDLARLAGLVPAAVICEIIKDDGTMARLPDLLAFAGEHGLKLGCIEDLIAHRRETEKTA